MSAYANSVQKPQRFDVYVRKLQSICVMHGVHIGSHRDLPGFLEQLVEDKHLAMDFWAFIGRLSHREGGELNDDQTLAVVIESITDSDVWQEDAGLKRTIDQLRALLTGVDIDHSADHAHSGDHADDEEPRREARDRGPRIAPFPKPASDRLHDERDDRDHDNDSSWSESGSEASQDPSSINRSESKIRYSSYQNRQDRIDEEAEQEPALSASHAPRLEEELLRIELTRLLKQYFDDVAKKISKGEYPQEATSMGTIASAMTRRSLEEPESEEMAEQRRRMTSRLVLEPHSFIDEFPPGPNTFLVRAPERHDPQLAGYGQSVGILLLIAWLIGGAFAIYPYHRPLQKGFRAWFNRQLASDTRTVTSLVPQSIAPSDDDDNSRASTSRPATSLPSPSQSAASSQSANQGTSNPPPAIASSNSSRTGPSSQRASSERGFRAPSATAHASSPGSSAPGPRPSTPRPLASSSVGSGGSRNAAVDRPIVQRDDSGGLSASPSLSAAADAVRIIQVDAAVMKSNLIASWVPIYPEAAKLSRIAGHVVMQAIISKEGTVRSVHVTEGDSRLRAAAVEAVYRWRYRPYVVDGQPVEVATTITVDFNLNG